MGSSTNCSGGDEEEEEGAACCSSRGISWKRVFASIASRKDAAPALLLLLLLLLLLPPPDSMRRFCWRRRRLSGGGERKDALRIDRTRRIKTIIKERRGVNVRAAREGRGVPRARFLSRMHNRTEGRIRRSAEDSAHARGHAIYRRSATNACHGKGGAGRAPDRVRWPLARGPQRMRRFIVTRVFRRGRFSWELIPSAAGGARGGTGGELTSVGSRCNAPPVDRFGAGGRGGGSRIRRRGLSAGAGSRDTTTLSSLIHLLLEGNWRDAGPGNPSA